MGGQTTASTGCKAGQCPGGTGGERKRRPSSNRRDRATRRGGETQPERVRTSHRSSRKGRKKGNGKRGPYGRAASGTERPRLSTPGLVPDRLDHMARRVQSLRLRIFRASAERHAGKRARAVLRGRGPGDRLLLPDRPLVPRCAPQQLKLYPRRIGIGFGGYPRG